MNRKDGTHVSSRVLWCPLRTFIGPLAESLLSRSQATTDREAAEHSGSTPEQCPLSCIHLTPQTFCPVTATALEAEEFSGNEYRNKVRSTWELQMKEAMNRRRFDR